MEATDTRESGTGSPEPTGLIARVLAWDLAFLRMLVALDLPPGVRVFLRLLVRVGDGWIWGLAALYLFLSMPDRFWSVVWHCLLTVGISLCFYWPVKLLLRRPRPHTSVLGVTAGVPPLDKFSFPSGHTMNNLAVALTLSLYLPQLLVPALVLPLVWGVLRILFGVHYLTDIAGGALLGGLSFFLAKAAFAAI